MKDSPEIKDRTNGTDLLRDCAERLQDYVHLQDERVYLFLAAWTLATYLYLIFSHFGYLFFHSLLPRSGKTRIEEVLSHLAFEACDPLNAPMYQHSGHSLRGAHARSRYLGTMEGKEPGSLLCSHGVA